MSVQCGQRNTDGTTCQRPVVRRGAPCGATHGTAAPAANPGAAAAVAAVPGPDPFAGPAPEPAGLTLGPPDKFGYQDVDIRPGRISDDAGRELIGRASARSFAVMNGRLPAEVLDRLAGDDDWEVRWRVANHRDAPVAALVRLSGDGDEEIRAAVANHKATPPATLLLLAADGHPSVAGAAAAHPRCPPAGRAAAGLLAD